MTPAQKILWLILNEANSRVSADPLPYPCENIEDLYLNAEGSDIISDSRYDIRASGIKTNLPSPHSRHYSCYEVAEQLPDGSWVGWPYWFGGGKHGEPEAIGWIPFAYDVSCKEEMKVVQVFSRGQNEDQNK